MIEADIRKAGCSGRKKTYTDDVKKALVKIWYIMDCICGKRLAPVMRQIVQKLEDFNEISLKEDTRAKLVRISASTIDRLVAGERRKQSIKGRSNTKPGTLSVRILQ